VLARTIFVLLGVGLWLSPAQAQKQTAHLTIQVNDMTGAVIPKAHVEILDVSTTFTKKLATDDDGKLSIDLPFGTYEVVASYPAFRTEKRKIEVNTAKQTVTFMLNVLSGGGVEVEPMSIEQTVASLDRALFDAYNTCDLATFKSLLADDIEFYHDKTGVTLGKDKLTEAIKNNICGKVTRELVGKLEVYPMQGIGAVEIGVHRFHHPGQTPDVVGEAKLVQLWVYKDGAWKVSRIFSFDHHEAK
jgi:Domain of unknown function (DUF4440)/Carboxypeptidase regulatory-like domain